MYQLWTSVNIQGVGSGQKLTILDGKIAGIHDSLPDVKHE